MSYIINTQPLSKEAYEAEYVVIELECQARFNEATNFTEELMWWHPFDVPEYVWEAEDIFLMKFGISIDDVRGGMDYCKTARKH